MQDDVISRQAVLDKIKEVCFSKEQEWVDFRVSQGSNGQRDLIIKFIEDSPSVQPQPKTGHWIYEDVLYSRCSECGELAIIANWAKVLSDFCPCCGARMVEPQEREE